MTESAYALSFNHYNDASKLVDISGTGNQIILSDDQATNVVTTTGRSGFFEAGNVCIGANGGIGKPDICGSMDFTNQQIPTASVIFNGGNDNEVLLPYWDDLNPSQGGQIFWEEKIVDGINTLIVQWNDLPHFPSTGAVKFQLQLFECGPISARYVYPDVDFGSSSIDFGASATIGYQSDPGTGLEISFNQPNFLANDDVIDLIDDNNPCPLVAGKILPIDTVALLLTSLQIPNTLSLTFLLVPAGIFGVLYYNYKRRN